MCKRSVRNGVVHLCSIAVLAAPFAAPVGRTLVVEGSTPTGATAVYSVSASGAQLRRLAAGSDPAVSPDGRLIAFARGRALYAMRRDGSHIVRLTHDDRVVEHPSWSPDGKRIAFARARAALWVIDANGRHARKLADGEVLARPSWSADGRSVLFEASGSRYGTPQLRIAHLDGTAAVPLTGLPVDASDPVWSHDGTKLAFSARDATGVEQIFVAHADGAAAVQLTTSHVPAVQPAWSPDDSRLAYTVVGTTRNAIAVVSASGGDAQVILAASSRSFDAPAW